MYSNTSHEGNAQSRISFHLCRKKTKWQAELPKGFVCPIPPSMGLILVGRGQFISGRLANRLGSPFGMHTKLLHGVIGLIMII